MRVAALLAPRPRLEIVPGWSFAHTDTDTSWRAGLRRKVWRFYSAHPARHPITVPWLGETRLHLYLGNDLSKCIFVDGLFEPNEFAFLAGFLQPGMTFVDVGANEGAYTVFAARCVGTGGSVIAVEPSSREFDRLRANVDLNGLTNVSLVREAAGDTTGETSLAVAAYGHEGQNTLGTRVVNPGVETARTEEVALSPLDDILTRAAVEHVEFVKIDVEGSEPRVLTGARAMLEQHRPVLQLELEPEWLHRQGSSPEEVFGLLDAARYEVWIFDRVDGAIRRLREGDKVNGNVLAGPSGWRPS